MPLASCTGSGQGSCRFGGKLACLEHRLSRHFSLQGVFFGSQKASAAQAALEQALTWLHHSGGSYPKSHGVGGSGGSWREGFTALPFRCHLSAGSAESIFLWLPATAASPYRLGLALVPPEPDPSFSFLSPLHNKPASPPFLHAAFGPQHLCRPHPELGAFCKAVIHYSLTRTRNKKTGLRPS